MHLSRAFLTRHYSFEPYMMGLAGLWIIGIALVLPGFLRSSSHLASVHAEELGGRVVVLSPRVSVISRGWTWLGVLAVWGGLAVPFVAHYFLVADRPWEKVAYGFGTVVGVLALLALWRTWHYKQINSSVSEALLALAEHPLVVVGRPGRARSR